MLFSEIYSCYYNTVAKIVSAAAEGDLDTKKLREIVRENAFAESGIDIPEALSSGRWPLLLPDYESVLYSVPEMPLTEIEKRWLKSITKDPRAKLFDIDVEGLEDVEPLYPQDTFVRFDVFDDGDPYDSPAYIDNFRKILSAVRKGSRIAVEFTDSKGRLLRRICVPDNLEYSLKNDRFRLIASCEGGNVTINLAAVKSAEEVSAEEEILKLNREKRELLAEITDESNALQRAMISFSYLEKETSKIDDRHYRLKLRYYLEDEAEILIQILSFGTNIRVISPDDFVLKIKDRIERQKNLKFSF